MVIISKSNASQAPPYGSQELVTDWPAVNWYRMGSCRFVEAKCVHSTSYAWLHSIRKTMTTHRKLINNLLLFIIFMRPTVGILFLTGKICLFIRYADEMDSFFCCCCCWMIIHVCMTMKLRSSFLFQLYLCRVRMFIVFIHLHILHPQANGCMFG